MCVSLTDACNACESESSVDFAAVIAAVASSATTATHRGGGSATVFRKYRMRWSDGVSTRFYSGSDDFDVTT